MPLCFIQVPSSSKAVKFAPGVAPPSAPSSASGKDKSESGGKGWRKGRGAGVGAGATKKMKPSDMSSSSLSSSESEGGADGAVDDGGSGRDNDGSEESLQMRAGERVEFRSNGVRATITGGGKGKGWFPVTLEDGSKTMARKASLYKVVPSLPRRA